MRRKKQEQGAPASADGRVTPVDVQQVEFRLAFRGYNERDVDAFLDKITEDLSAYMEENERLRGGAPLAPAASVSGAETEEILARARDEAAAIVRRAEEDAVAIRAAAGTGGGNARAAVAPFLNREREFLQSLGTLVQGHAEEIKQMVLTLRARTESGAEGAAASPVEQPAPTQTLVEEESERPGGETSPPARDEERPDPFVPASTSEIAERLGMTESSKAEEERSSEVGTVVIESATEPAYSSEGAPAGERRERSLRELFWGED